ncbi:Arm DNA-binding domain-containing protein [Erwinia pyrifoliae]|uniref:Arm DNA-binding domain-containing protein n=1 Tax=Erwinia pyrifoliae TaxID=79967 RepID=UPI00223B820F|nr:Arm DNA-binding domain-containing protein [Erwinia pyrifoliae]MCT2386863.1 Arm DNA-binding domain-containing protein [Erwinia pyrifoliae]MCU8587538.1 Arm DNA-binding domain-containing protein [Erwinia pyrifoliae]
MALTGIKIRNTEPSVKAVKLTNAFAMYLLIHPNGSKYWRELPSHQPSVLLNPSTPMLLNIEGKR